MKPNYTSSPITIPLTSEKLTLFPDGWGTKGKATGQAKFTSAPIQEGVFTLFVWAFDNETAKKVGLSAAGSLEEIINKRVEEELAKRVQAVPPTIRKASDK